MLAKRSLPLLFVAVACLSVAAPKNSDKKFWNKQYSQINAMFKNKDTEAFIALLSPDYHEVDQRGKTISREDFIKNEVDPIKGASSVKSNIKLTSINEKGDDAQVGYDWHFTLRMKDSKTVGHEVGTDVWHRTNGKWLNTSTTVKSATAKTTPIKPKKKK